MIFCKYNFNINFIDDFKIPDFFGSILRGGFGKVFKETTCRNNSIGCKECEYIYDCPYSYIFETNIVYNDKYFNAPHPFVFETFESENDFIRKNETYNFNLLLFGKGISFFPIFIRTFENYGKKGVGKNHSRFYIDKIVKNNNIIYKDQILYKGWEIAEKIDNKFYDLDDIITIEFISPTKIIFEKKLISIPSFEVIISAIIRRLNLLQTFHNIGWNLENKEEILKKSNGIEIFKYDLYDIFKKRYSFRRKMEMEFKGFKGSITFKGDFKPFIEILRLGEIVHIGKATAFGFGQFKIKRG